ncbi:methyltransferase [Hirsutella rhossiliensis]|uniref:Methyltransferase domain-containing protein n=1 Tax=Hirsutella rhossiliensis TaxID=111463 RepID=A0A9P8SL14_9HYPO|nr:methyltransferase domain-containing protein [Hirsutella rhossiliensis]KAH0966993.1 methyltransferase domain-containing protein [Hirsutella rhossiliensis]
MTSPAVSNPAAAAEEGQEGVSATARDEQPPASSATAGGADEPAPEAYEDAHVHAVYEAIAPHFSSTRHKPWPLVADFLLAQRPGSIGLDVGCGNGKYLCVNRAVHLLGSDRSAALVRLAAAEGRGLGHVVVADGLALPYRAAAVDFVVSIAVVHHLSTRARRRDAIAALLRCLRPGPDARALVYVWALEQGGSRRGWHEGSEQDTLVPWVMRSKGAPEATYQRYYHLYRQGELEDDVCAAGGSVLESGYERDNWWVVCNRSDNAEEPHREPGDQSQFE